MIITHNEHKYEIELENVSYDHDYWCDAFISSAYDLTEDRELSQQAVDDLMDAVSLEMDNYIMRWLY